MSTNGSACYRKGNTTNAPNYRLVDAASDVYAPTPTDGSIVKWTTANQRWENAPGFGSYFKSGYVDLDATCTAWGAVTYARRLYWGQAGSLMVLFIPSTIQASIAGQPSGPVTFSAALPNNLWPIEPVVDHKVALNLSVYADCTVTISTTGTITIYEGINFGDFDALAGTDCGGVMMYVPYKINFVAGSSGPIIPSPIPALRFIDLTDTQAVYITPYSLIRVKGANNGVSEFDLQATLPALNQFRLTSGTSALTVTSSCTIDQDLSTTSNPQFATIHVTGKATVDGVLDPTALYFTPQSTNPSISRAIWSDEVRLYIGNNLLGSAVEWVSSIDGLARAAAGQSATVIVTSSAQDAIHNAMAAATDGAVIEVRANGPYRATVVPAGKRLIVKSGAGYVPVFTGVNALTFANGARDIVFHMFAFADCNTGVGNDNYMGSAVGMEHYGIIQRILFSGCTFTRCEGSAILMSYHQTIGGDQYDIANAPAELSYNMGFVSCSFTRTSTNAAESASIVLRGFVGAVVKQTYINNYNLAGRGLLFQNCIGTWLDTVSIQRCGAGASAGEGIKVTNIGTPLFAGTLLAQRVEVRSCNKGILATGNQLVALGDCRAYKNVAIGIQGSGAGSLLLNQCKVYLNGTYGVRITTTPLYTVNNCQSYLNVTANFFPAVDNSNSEIPADSWGNADSIPYLSTGALVSTNVEDALNEIGGVYQVAKNPTGFSSSSRSSSTMTIVDGATPTFTLAGGPFDYWQWGSKRSFTSSTIPITDVEGLHYVYIDDTTLYQTTVWDIRFITDWVAVSIFYWEKGSVPANSKATMILDERHEFMDPTTHLNLHLHQGTVWTGGLALSGFTIGNGSLDSHAEFGNDTGTIMDEDLTTTPSTGVAGTVTYYVFYRDGATGVWRTGTPSLAPLMNAPAGRIYYNQYTGGAWTRTEVADTKYALIHMFATNSYATNKRLIAIMGQAVYNSGPAARAGAVAELASIQLGALPTAEFIAIGTVCYQTANAYANTWKARVILVDGANYVDWRQKTINPTTSPSSHHNLSDLNSYDDHPQKLQLSSPSTVTDAAVALWDGTGGEYVKNSVVTIGASGSIYDTLSSGKVLTFLDASSTHYIGVDGTTPLLNGVAFGRGASTGMAINSSQNIYMHIADSGAGAYNFGITTNETDFGVTNLLWKCTYQGRISHLSESTYYNSFIDDDTMATATANSISSSESIKAYTDSKFESGTFSCTLTGVWAADKTITVKYARAGNVVTGYFPTAYGAANASNSISSTTACIPATVRPAQDENHPIHIEDNTTIEWGRIKIGTDGTVRIYTQGGTGAFAGTGNAGIRTDCSVSWVLG